MPSLLIRGGTLLPMREGARPERGDVLLIGSRIEEMGVIEPRHDTEILDASGCYVMPGLVQTHVHLVQTIFRGGAEDLPLLEWLRRRVWPLEAAHSPRTLRASTRLAASELLLSGTTTVLSMETVHHTEVVFETLAEIGLRAVVGKCMMDSNDGVPPGLREETRRSVDESLALKRQWDGAANGRLHAAFAPRFAVSCSRELLEAVAALSARDQALIHTHASESRDEVDIVRRISGGYSNLEYLAATGLATRHLCVAHCVWVTEREQELLAARDVKVMHCPGSNLKLGSGIAPVPEMRARGISVSLGADGAACNNRLDMFEEMRLAATLQAMRRGPGALTARDVLWMATREGARTLGQESELGSIEVGKRADLILVQRDRPHLAPDADPWSTLAYAARGTDVQLTMVDGQILVRDFKLEGLDAAEVTAEARAATAELVARAGI